MLRLSPFLILKLYRNDLANFAISFFCFFLFISAKSQQPKILHFGWDNPDVERLSDSIGFMQNIPFDGICISFQKYIMESFDTTIHPETYYKYDKLRCIKWGRYTDNYLFIRGMSKTGGSWFDNKAWASISKNMKGVSRAIKEGRLKGILFDSEYYYADPLYNPWTYTKLQYPNYSFSQVQDMVRERGKQFIKALQNNTKDFSILSIWLTSLVADEMRYAPFEKSRFALLLSFMEGILLEKNKKVKLIDGNESAYWYSKPSQFLESVENLQRHTTELMRSARAKKLVPEILIAQPVFYDGLLATSTEYERGFKNTAKWKWLQENLKYAMATSTSNMIWFYDEKLNIIKSRSDTLFSVIKNAKSYFTGFNKSESLKGNKFLAESHQNINSEIGIHYLGFGKDPMATTGKAFSYRMNIKTKHLSITFIERIPISVSIFLNNKLIAFVKPNKLKNEIKLTAFTKGILAILSKYSDGTESCNLQIY